MDATARDGLRAGDGAVLGQLFDDHADAIHRYAVRSCGDWSVAQDVVSLTFLEAWRLRGTVRPGDEPLRPWLFGIATNVLRNTARSARRHRVALARMPGADPVPDFADALVDRLDDAEALDTARRVLAQLDRKDREVIELCVWAGLDYVAAATALGVPVGTVRSRLSRARARLRESAARDAEPTNSNGQTLPDRAIAVSTGQEGKQ